MEKNKFELSKKWEASAILVLTDLIENSPEKFNGFRYEQSHVPYTCSFAVGSGRRTSTLKYNPHKEGNLKLDVYFRDSGYGKGGGKLPPIPFEHPREIAEDIIQAMRSETVPRSHFIINRLRNRIVKSIEEKTGFNLKREIEKNLIK